MPLLACALLLYCSPVPLQVVLDRVKNAERLPGVDEILLPSERGSRVAQQRLSSGMVPIEANLYNNLKVGCGVRC
jgi:LDH2 family malate/lactate/ureidoglycolate dehydrogenase